MIGQLPRLCPIHDIDHEQQPNHPGDLDRAPAPWRRRRAARGRLGDPRGFGRGRVLLRRRSWRAGLADRRDAFDVAPLLRAAARREAPGRDQSPPSRLPQDRRGGDARGEAAGPQGELHLRPRPARERPRRRRRQEADGPQYLAASSARDAGRARRLLCRRHRLRRAAPARARHRRGQARSVPPREIPQAARPRLDHLLPAAAAGSRRHAVRRLAAFRLWLPHPALAGRQRRAAGPRQGRGAGSWRRRSTAPSS